MQSVNALPTHYFQGLFVEMESAINDLALEWRSCEDAESAAQIAAHYGNILRCMIQLGFNRPLDMDAELPYALMPQEYFDLFKQP